MDSFPLIVIDPMGRDSWAAAVDKAQRTAQPQITKWKKPGELHDALAFLVQALLIWLIASFPTNLWLDTGGGSRQIPFHPQK